MMMHEAPAASEEVGGGQLWVSEKSSMFVPEIPNKEITRGAFPLFNSVMFCMALVPVATVLKLALNGRLTIGAVTLVVALKELLVATGSVAVVETVAAFTAAPAAVGVTTIVIVALNPFGIALRLHVTVPADGAHVPRVVIADTNVAPGGSKSFNITAVPESAPLFVTATV